MEYILTLSFLCSNNTKSSISIEGANKMLSSEEVTTLMDTIIEKNIFKSKNGSFIKKAGAVLTQKAVSKFTV